MIELIHNEWVDVATWATDDAIKNCMSKEAIGFWQENAITGVLLSSLEQIGTDIAWKGKSLRTTWKALKLSVPTETKFGDIAINVRLWVNEQQFIDGVAFYEAKRQYFKNGMPVGFRSIKEGQLGIIAKNTGASNALLYDHVVTDQGPRGVAATLSAPILELLESDAKSATTSRDIYRRSRHWAEALGENLIGRGLDFSENAVSTMAKIVASKTPPNFVVNVAVSFLDELVPQLNPIFDSKYKHLTQSNKPAPSSKPNDNDSGFQPS
ncbi:hypothetical protein PS689_00715 [Pseudomonas fluorescens]|nr:hypothetical protein PS689_00715 [Pseudomonas fluorescens]